MGEARSLKGIYYSYTPTEGTRASCDAKSYHREGARGQPRQRVRFHHGRGRVGDVKRKSEEG